MLDMTFGGVMFRLLVPQSGAELLGHALLALLQRLRPEWEVVQGEYQAVSAGTTFRLEDGTTGRWMAIVFSPDLATGAAQAVAGGACSVVSSASRLQDFEKALETLVRSRGSYIPPTIAVRLAREAAGLAHKDRQNEHLTPRELEVLQCVARGMSNKEIALDLGVSVNTVRTHLHSLASKLDASSRASIAAVAWQSGLVKENPYRSPVR